MAEDNEVRDYIKKIIKEEVVVGTKPGEDVGLGEFSKFISTMSAFEELEKKRNPIQSAITEKIGERLVESLIPSLSQPHKTGFLDSGMMQQVGAKLPETIPAILDILVKHFGREKAAGWIDNVQNRFLGGKEQSVDELILSLDSERPEDLQKYMALRNLNDVDVARKTLNYEKEKLMSKMKASTPTSGASASDLEKILSEQNEMMKGVASRIQQDEEIIKYLHNENVGLKSELSEIKNMIKNIQPIQRIEKVEKIEIPEEIPEEEKGITDELREKWKKKDELKKLEKELEKPKYKVKMKEEKVEKEMKIEEKVEEKAEIVDEGDVEPVFK